MNAYEVDPGWLGTDHADAGREVWLHCPVCSATYPASATDQPCPNAGQDDHAPHDRPSPSITEIAALTARLRHLSSAQATAAEREAFIADKNALLARITGTPTHQPHDRKD